MNKKKIYFLCLIYLINYGCKTDKIPDVESGLFFQDFDNLRYWNQNAFVTDYKSHSGVYSTFTDSTREFSETFCMNTEIIRRRKFKKVSISAWCLIPNISNTIKLVASIDNNNNNSKPLLYKAMDINSIVNNGIVWTQIKYQTELPDLETEQLFFKVYLWSPEKKIAFLDDITIKFD